MFKKITEEIKQPYYKQNYTNDGQRFVAWYLRNVHLQDENQTKADITDGADDKQIDARIAVISPDGGSGGEYKHPGRNLV